MNKKRVAINGFGRIGRSTLKRILKKYQDIDVVAINDLADPKILTHLLRYDSSYGIYERVVKERNGNIMIDGVKEGRQIKVLTEKDPENLPWREMGIDIVIECTGLFRDFESANKHIKAGAKTVIISAPSKDPEKIPSYIMGVNNDLFNPEKDKIVDMGSCTTNCLAPIAKALNKNYGIEKGFITTIHSYTSDQRLLDAPHKDFRRARSAAVNMVPTTTGAAGSIGRVIPELKGRFDGMAIRVPTPTVSILDLVVELKKETTKEEINYTLKKESQNKDYCGVFGVEDAPLVSSDYVGNYFSCIVDADFTFVKNNMVKILAWYDNEWAYACRLADFTAFI